MLEHYVGFTMPADGSCARVRTWLDAMLARPSVQQTMVFDKDPALILNVCALLVDLLR